MALRLEQKYSLGEFLLEPDKRLLSRDGEAVHLSKLPFQLLLYLVEHRERVVTRRELLEQFWGGPGVYEDTLRRRVYEDTLRKSVAAVRKALGDGNGNGGRPRYVETCRGEGYRYVGPFRELPLLEGSGATPRAAAVAGFEAHEPTPASAADRDTTAGGATPPQSPAAPLHLTPPPRGKTYLALTAALLALAVTTTALVAQRWRGAAVEAGGPARPAPPRSVAVLPLKNLTQDPANDYLCDGVTESLINALSRAGGLKVVARGSAFSLKGREADPREVGRRLGVAAVLEGGLSRAGNRVRVEVRLVSAEDGSVLWADAPYDRELGDILALQEEIALRAAAGLEYRLSAEDERRLAGRQTRSAAAYQEYLKGRYHLNQRTREGIERATDYFQRAVELDQNYALAYAALAESHDKYYWLGYAKFPPWELLAKQRAAAERALALDDSLAEAHIAMASVYNNGWDLLRSARELERAIELDPRNAEARHNYAYRLLDTLRTDEAVAQIKMAHELDPLNVVMNVDVAEILLLARRYDEAIEAYRHALEMDPNRANAYEGLGWAYEFKGLYDEAVSAFLKAFELSGRRPEEIDKLRRAYESGGMTGYWRKNLEQKLRRGDAEPVEVGNIYTRLGDKDRAFAWYEKAYQARSPSLLGYKSSAKVDSLRSDPRYADLARRISLP